MHERDIVLDIISIQDVNNVSLFEGALISASNFRISLSVIVLPYCWNEPIKIITTYEWLSWFRGLLPSSSEPPFMSSPCPQIWVMWIEGICAFLERIQNIQLLWVMTDSKYASFWEFAGNVFNEYLIGPIPSIRNILLWWRNLFTLIVSMNSVSLAWPIASTSPKLKNTHIFYCLWSNLRIWCNTFELAPWRLLLLLRSCFLSPLFTIMRFLSQSSLCSVSLASDILLDLPIFKQFWVLGLYSLK